VTDRACSARFATGATTGKTTAATGKTTAATGKTTGKTTAATGKTTGKTTAATGKTGVVAGPGCSGNRELDDQGGHAAARSVPWHLQTAGATRSAGKEWSWRWWLIVPLEAGLVRGLLAGPRRGRWSS
jgi:hypothetical protein